MVVRAKLLKMQSAGRPASSYYDPEGETIYLSPTPAPKGPEKARRRPELNDVFGYVGSATLLVAHSSVRESIYGAFEASTGPHAIEVLRFDAVTRFRRTQISFRRESDLAQAPGRRRLHEPLRVRVRAFRCGNFTPAPSRQPSRHRRNVCSMHRWASTASARRPTPPCSSKFVGSASRSPRS